MVTTNGRRGPDGDRWADGFRASHRARPPGLTCIDSTDLRLILEIDAASRQDGFNFAVVKGPEAVQRVFAIKPTEDGLVFVDAPEELLPPQEPAAGVRSAPSG